MGGNEQNIQGFEIFNFHVVLSQVIDNIPYHGGM